MLAPPGIAEQTLTPSRVLRRDALALLVSLGIMNASNYAFHLIVSRSLGPGEYGALSSLLAVLLVMSVPLNTLQTVVAKRTAELRGAGRAPEIPALSFAAVRVLGPLAVVVSLGLAAIAPLVGLLLDVGFVSATLLAMFALISLVLAVPLGVLQGQMRFGALATVLLAGAVCRLLGAVLLLDLGWGLEGALLATVLAPVVSLVLARRFLRERGVDRRERRSWNVTLLRGQFRQTLWNLGAFWTLAGVDVILARHYLGPREAGFYSSAALIARSFLFLGGAVSMLAFPWFVRTATKGREAARSLWVAVAITAALVLASLPPLLVWKETVVRLAFGPGFVPAAELVPILAIAMGILAIAHVLVYFCIAHGVRAHAILLPAVALEIAAVSVVHGSAQSVETVLLAVAAGVTAALGLTAWAACRSSRRADERRAVEAELGGSRAGHRGGRGAAQPLRGDAVPQRWARAARDVAGDDRRPRWFAAVGDRARLGRQHRRHGGDRARVRGPGCPVDRLPGTARQGSTRCGSVCRPREGSTWPSSTRTATSSPRRSPRSSGWSTCTTPTRSSDRSDIRCRTSTIRRSGGCSPGPSTS